MRIDLEFDDGHSYVVTEGEYRERIAAIESINSRIPAYSNSIQFFVVDDPVDAEITQIQEDLTKLRREVERMEDDAQSEAP